MRVLQDDMTAIWQGHTVIASLTVTIAGIVWWRSRHAAWLPRTLGRLWMRGIRPVGLLLACASAATVLLDEQIRQQVRHLHNTQAETLYKTLMLHRHLPKGFTLDGLRQDLILNEAFETRGSTRPLHTPTSHSPCSTSSAPRDLNAALSA